MEIRRLIYVAGREKEMNWMAKCNVATKKMGKLYEANEMEKQCLKSKRK